MCVCVCVCVYNVCMWIFECDISIIDYDNKKALKSKQTASSMWFYDSFSTTKINKKKYKM